MVSSRFNRRSCTDFDDGDEYGPNFVDHFSLGEPSSTVKFRGNRVHVYDGFNEQFLLEDRKSPHSNRHDITVKRVEFQSFGLVLLRLSYLCVALLVFAGCFVVTFQIILFLFVKVAIEGKLAAETLNEDGSTDVWPIIPDLIGTILSCPLFLYGFSNLMGMATTFVAESWNGGDLIRSIMGLKKAVMREIVFFFFFILVPVVTYIVCVFEKVDRPWEFTVYAWATSVLVAFFFFCFGVVSSEFKNAYRLITIHHEEDKGFFSQTKRSFLIVLQEKYSGTVQEQYVVNGDEPVPSDGFTFSERKYNDRSKSLYTRITEARCLKCMFETLDQPKRVYSVDEIIDELPFLTKNTWSLETTFCMGNKERTIMAVKGHSSVRFSQILASAGCNIGGTLLAIAAVVGYLFWLDLPTSVLISVGILLILFGLVPMVISNIEAVKTYTHRANKGSGPVDEEEGSPEDLADATKTQEAPEGAEEINYFRLWETSRVTQPKDWVCWTGLALEIIFLFALPVANLFTNGLWGLGCVFIVLSIFSFLRIYIDESAVLTGLGALADVRIETGKKKRQSVEKTIKRKARLANIVGKVSRAESVTRWSYFYIGFVLFVLILVSLAAAGDDGLGDKAPIPVVDDFEYIGEKSVQYPSCSLSKGFGIEIAGVRQDTALADYAFLSALGYEETDKANYILPKMFGEGVVIDEGELVTKIREELGNEKIPVVSSCRPHRELTCHRRNRSLDFFLEKYFKFFSFPVAPDAGLIVIRGSTTVWDWMVNFQIWSSSALAQIMKWLLPYGWIWTAVMDDVSRHSFGKISSFYYLWCFNWYLLFLSQIAWVASFLQTDDLEKALYSNVTVAFANEMKSNYSNLQVAGHSLGGGTAMITGTQAKLASVAFSGPSPVLPLYNLGITRDDINQYAFNVIPDRDFIPRIGGRVRNNQQIECRANTSSLIGCHSMWRRYVT